MVHTSLWAHSVPPVLQLPGQYLAHQQYRHLRQESVRGRGIRQQVRDGAHSGNHRLTQYPVVASQYRANRVRHQWLYQPLSGFYRENALREDSHHRDQGRPSGQRGDTDQAALGQSVAGTSWPGVSLFPRVSRQGYQHDRGVPHERVPQDSGRTVTNAQNTTQASINLRPDRPQDHDQLPADQGLHFDKSSAFCPSRRSKSPKGLREDGPVSAKQEPERATRRRTRLGVSTRNRSLFLLHRQQNCRELATKCPPRLNGGAGIDIMQPWRKRGRKRRGRNAP